MPKTTVKCISVAEPKRLYGGSMCEDCIEDMSSRRFWRHDEARMICGDLLDTLDAPQSTVGSPKEEDR